MRIPALFALIALGTFSPAARWAAASSTAQGANSGHFTPHASNTGAALGPSGNAVGGHARAAHSIAAQAFAAPVLGGRAPYGAKKGAVIGGPAISNKR
jgi:hypothetical protein